MHGPRRQRAPDPGLALTPDIAANLSEPRLARSWVFSRIHVHPHQTLETRVARNVLARPVRARAAREQSSDLALLLAGCYRGDLEAIRLRRGQGRRVAGELGFENRKGRKKPKSVQVVAGEPHSERRPAVRIP